MIRPIRPIRPNEVSKNIPDFVIESFNELIAEKLFGGDATVLLSEAKQRISEKTAIPLKLWWLDIEPLYEKAGWSVEFDRPGFNESYASKYIFIDKS